MNNFILFHKGRLPAHIKYCLQQIIITQTNYKIHLLTDNNIIIDGINVVNINDLNVNFNNLNYYKDHSDPLWRTAFERFFYINEFIVKNNINNVIHFDNDVMVYYDIYKLQDKLRKNISDIALTPHKETELVCGFMFIKESNSLKLLCDELYKLAILGERKLEEKLNTMPHEMRLLGYIQQNTNNYITSLPVSPYGPGSNLYSIFNGVFDPSTYGQYFGNDGIIKEQDINRLADRFIGKKVNPKFDNTPVLYLNENESHIPIFNLHIHNKDLLKFSSKY